MKVSLENGDAEGFIADVDPNVASAVETAKRDFLGDRVVAESPLRCEDRFFETFPRYSGFTGDEACQTRVSSRAKELQKG